MVSEETEEVAVEEAAEVEVKVKIDHSLIDPTEVEEKVLLSNKNLNQTQIKLKNDHDNLLDHAA